MFADDVASVADTKQNLQRQINYIEQFCNVTGMKINVDKSKIMVFRRGGPLRSYEQWYFNGNQIEVVPYYKYLGAFFTPTLSWSKTQDTLRLQATKAVASIYTFQKRFGYFHLKDAFKLFDSIVTPILCYSSEMWGYSHSENIERVHSSFCKYIACLNRNVSNCFALSECGRHPLNVIYMTRCIKYWTKLISMPNHRYPKNCYMMLRDLDDAGKTTWATGVKQLLFEHGFGYAWVAGEVGNMTSFISMFKNRVKDCAIQKMQGFINSSPKALHYRHFKSLLNPERYLSMDLPFVLKKSYSNFRCSSHALQI